MGKECSLQLAVSADASRERREGGGSLAEDPDPRTRQVSKVSWTLAAAGEVILLIWTTCRRTLSRLPGQLAEALRGNDKNVCLSHGVLTRI